MSDATHSAALETGVEELVKTRTQRTIIGRQIGRLLSRTLLRSLLRSGQEARRTQFDVLGPLSGSVVMLGDSITEFGNWDEWFPGVRIVNRGVGGEFSNQVLTRLESAIDQPSAVFLLIGTNDLSAAISELEIVRNVESILHLIERAEPGTPVFVQSVMPRSSVFLDEITALNLRYRELVAAAPEHVRFLDLWPALATSRGALRPNLTQDSLHLNGSGYRAWVDVLRPIMSDFVAGDQARAPASGGRRLPETGICAGGDPVDIR